MLLSRFFVIHFWHYSFSHPHSLYSAFAQTNVTRMNWHWKFYWVDMATAANCQPLLSQNISKILDFMRHRILPPMKILAIKIPILLPSCHMKLECSPFVKLWRKTNSCTTNSMQIDREMNILQPNELREKKNVAKLKEKKSKLFPQIQNNWIVQFVHASKKTLHTHSFDQM